LVSDEYVYFCLVDVPLPTWNMPTVLVPAAAIPDPAKVAAVADVFTSPEYVYFILAVAPPQAPTEKIARVLLPTAAPLLVDVQALVAAVTASVDHVYLSLAKLVPVFAPNA
jgi:hypothetical protein